MRFVGGRDNLKIIRDFNTGFEAFLLTSLGEEDAKRLCVGIEEEHPLGRLMDIDVIGHDGGAVISETFRSGSTQVSDVWGRRPHMHEVWPSHFAGIDT